MVCTTKELASRMLIPVIDEGVSGGASVAECEQVLIDMAWFVPTTKELASRMEIPVRYTDKPWTYKPWTRQTLDRIEQGACTLANKYLYIFNTSFKCALRKNL
jgi:hypothetical protein